MYAAAGGASLAGRKARQHGRQPAPPSPRPHSPLHPAPTGVRAYSCQHWEARLAPPARPLSAPAEHHSPCDGNECAAGRAAWQEAAAVSIGGGGAGAGGAARRCSVLGDHPGARRDPRAKWHRNNRVRDASYGSSSESDGEPDGTSGEPWGVARLLYAGLGTLALGLVVYFVGTGDKGFKTPALRLVGPSLIVAGLACCFVRILFCIFAKPCCRRRPSYKETRRMSVCGEGEEMPLAGCGRGAARGPAQCSPARRLDSSCDVSSLSSGEEDERLRRYRTHSIRTTQIASQGTSLHSPLQQSASNQSALQPTVSPQSLVQSASAHSAIQQSASPQNALHPSASPQNALHPSASTQNAFQQSASPQNALQQSASPQNALQQSASTQNALQQSASTRNVFQQSASTQNTLHQSALTQPAGAGPPARRPPPRTVSFAGGPDGELVLSPAQLRS